MLRRRVRSFKHAIDGLYIGLKDQFNLKIHFLVAYLVIIAGLYFRITAVEWMILIISISLVIGAELFNTAVEEIVNSFTNEVHPSAKKAKDVAAAAVLVFAITAFWIGIIIFTPYLSEILP